MFVHEVATFKRDIKVTKYTTKFTESNYAFDAKISSLLMIAKSTFEV